MENVNRYLQHYCCIARYDKPQIVASLTHNNIRYNPNFSTECLRTKLVSLANQIRNEGRRNGPSNTCQYQMEIEFYIDTGNGIIKAHDCAHSYIVDMSEGTANMLNNFFIMYSKTSQFNISN